MYIFIFLIGVNFCFAQISPIDQALEYVAEMSPTESPDLVQVAEQLNYLYHNPIPLNTATPDQLLEIPLLNTFLAFKIIQYRNTSGRILSFYQLADIDGLTPQFINLIKPFLTLQYVSETALIPRNFTHTIALQYRRIAQQSRAFNEHIYTGDANAFYLRYRTQAQGRLHAGLTLQKDAGEAYLTNGLPDFASFFVAYKLNDVVKNIVVGDFVAEFGQGLVLWNSFAFSKSSEAVSTARFGRNIRQFTGADENRFMRGAAASIQFKDIEISPFLSAKKVDANLAHTESTIFATSLQQTGYHRTASEIADKNSLHINTAGAYIQWKPKRLRLGLLNVHTHFKYPLQFKNTPENLHKFSGNQLTHTALDFKYLYGRLFFYGEAAFLWQQNALSAAGGLQVHAADGVQWTVHARYLPPKWYAPYAQPFSETGKEGESGVYIGLNWQLPKKLSLALFADHFNYLWMRTNLDFPGTGQDYMLQLNFLPQRVNTYLRVRYQSRLRNVPSNEVLTTIAPLNRVSARWHATFQATQHVAFQTRIEWAQAQHMYAPENGLLSYIGANISLASRWRFKMRYTIYNTQSYASAIWAFEDDVPYSFSVPANYNNGNKWYVMLTYKPFAHTEIWLRLAELNYVNQSSIGSGYDKIDGSKRTEIKALVRIDF